MPTDSNGVYSLPATYLAVTGATITAAEHNTPLEDVQSALTARLCVNGSNPMTGPLRHSDGSAAAPSVTFSNAVTTGLYKTATGFGVSVAGVKVAEFTAGGLASGARFIGELFPFVGSTAPAFCVFPVGQTLSRTTYADLWTIAQAEIALGNLFFNNGNGTTTFGIGDLRGRVAAAKDASAGRLSSVTMTPDGNTLGAIGGGQLMTIAQPNLPNVTLGVTGTVSVTSTVGNVVTGSIITNFPAGGGGAVNSILSGTGVSGTLTSTGSLSSGVTGSLNGGISQTATINMQPTIITNYAMFAGA